MSLYVWDKRWCEVFPRHLGLLVIPYAPEPLAGFSATWRTWLTGLWTPTQLRAKLRLVGCTGMGNAG